MISSILFCVFALVAEAQTITGHFGEIFDEAGSKKDRGLMLDYKNGIYTGTFYIADVNGVSEQITELTDIVISGLTIIFAINGENFTGTFTLQCVGKYMLECHSTDHWYVFRNRGCA